MAVTDYEWTVAPAAAATIPADEVLSPLDRRIFVGPLAHLGHGLLRPFRRDQKNDFANGSGLELVKSAVGQVLGTHSSSDAFVGELRWRPEFGSLLWTLRHLKNDGSLRELARLHVVDALQRWEPRIAIKRVDVASESTADGGENVLSITIVYDVIQRSTPTNAVVLPNVEQVFRVAA